MKGSNSLSTHRFTGCKKGGRDCVYPEPSTTSKTSSTSKNAQAVNTEAPGSSSDEYDEETGIERSTLDMIPDEDESLDTAAALENTSITEMYGMHKPTRQQATAKISETPSLVQENKSSSPTPSTEGSAGYPAYQTASSNRQKQDSLRSDWSHLPPDLQFYLTYFLENVTYLHYSLKFDAGNFFKLHFIDAALRNDALLYAIVGFSAFQRTLHNPDGKIPDFLQYYNKAVSLLLRSLKKGEQHSTGTILAILQLATIEVSEHSPC